jgi:hypothetical protein
MVAITSKELNGYICIALLTYRDLSSLMSDSYCRMTMDINPSGPTLFILVSGAGLSNQKLSCARSKLTSWAKTYKVTIPSHA